MCGIAGAVSEPGGALAEGVNAQLACQHHRGPDAAGVFTSGRGAVAQNRLAIIDLALGDPPITSEDGKIGAVLNGEIYNFRELRRELETAGHQFATRCDTEVIAHLAEQLSPVALAQRLDGMFAFAVWDSRRERLVLGRDRFGKKPLHYWQSGERLVFASEIKGVLANPAVPRRFDPTAVPAYLAFGYVPSPRTFFEGIQSLPPGHVLTFGPGHEALLERYHAPDRRCPDVTEREPSLDEAAVELRRLLRAAVQRRLVADVPIGAFLSGGIDSSAVVATMAGLTDRPVSTFTIGFDDREGYDERPYARAVAQQFGTDHHEFVVQPDAVDLVEELVWHHDQPFGDSSAVPTYLLSAMTRDHVTVALCGDGGDELFAGYERFAAALAINRLEAIPSRLRSSGLTALHRLPAAAGRGRVGNLRRFAEVAERGMLEAYLHWLSFVDEPMRERLLAAPVSHCTDAHEVVWEATAGTHPLDRLLELNVRTYLLDDLLVKADRMSMAHGLEVRSPFLDADLAAYAVQLPPSLKLRGMSLKRVLKRAMRDELPPEIVRRRKRGFGVPLDRWFREDLRSYLGHMLGSRDARVRQHLRGDTIDGLIAEHAAGRRNRGPALWTLLTLEVFLRKQDW